MDLLHIAAKFAIAGDNGKHGKNYLLAAISVRNDGALVISQNALAQEPEPSTHAEARALRKSDCGCTLYVARVLRSGGWAMSKPCPKCQARIRNHRVKKVYYTISDGCYGIWDVKKNSWKEVMRKK